MHTLAIVTGSGWDVRKMAAQMPLDLYHDWLAFAELYPLFFDADYLQSRQDWNAGMVASAFMNTMTGMWSKRRTRLTAVDMMYKAKPRVAPRQKSASEIYQQFRAAVIAATPPSEN